ncbi:MAG: hypothetical protein JSU88_06615 [Nitrospinaceae bacterium]|jgi:hypothetical protein|nr:MAG: hypothetical protein JSU88_06615 [Nitrospinaceae bacterium]
MLYEVRVKQPNGEIKQVISPRQLSQRYWKNFEKSHSGITIPSNWKATVPRWVRERLDVEFI